MALMQADDKTFLVHLAASGLARAVLQGSAPLQEWLHEQLCLMTPLTDLDRLTAASRGITGVDMGRASS